MTEALGEGLVDEKHNFHQQGHHQYLQHTSNKHLRCVIWIWCPSSISVCLSFSLTRQTSHPIFSWTPAMKNVGSLIRKHFERQHRLASLFPPRFPRSNLTSFPNKQQENTETSWDKIKKLTLSKSLITYNNNSFCQRLLCSALFLTDGPSRNITVVLFLSLSSSSWVPPPLIITSI